MEQNCEYCSGDEHEMKIAGDLGARSVQMLLGYTLALSHPHTPGSPNIYTLKFVYGHLEVNMSRKSLCHMNSPSMNSMSRDNMQIPCYVWMIFELLTIYSHGHNDSVAHT